jgi:hypothetical protein
MQKFVQYIFVLFFVACIAACGGGTTAATVVYKLPVPVTVDLTNLHRLMGGAVQGTPLPLALGNPVTVSTLAGTPVSGPLIDGSPTTATFNQPNDVTFDNVGKNFYVADYWNNAIREVTPSGDITTLQCTDANGNAISFLYPSGITTDGTYLYVVDRGFNCIRVITIALDPVTNKHKVTTIGSASGLAGSVDSTDKTAVLFNQPVGITTDGVNVYVTDYGNAIVRWIDTSDSIHNNYAVYTLAGASGAVGLDNSTGGDPSTARFNLPTRITTDGTNLYVTDVLNRTIRQIAIKTGQVTTLAGKTGELSNADIGSLDGFGTAASFREPNGITTDGTNLYVTDSFLGIIRIIVITTGEVTTLPLPATLSPLGGRFLGPLGITTDGLSLFVADTNFVSRDPNNFTDTTIFSNSILKVQ